MHVVVRKQDVAEAMEFEIITESNYSEVVRIYEEGISTGYATFQTKAYRWEEWNHSHLLKCRYLGVLNAQFVGWAALSGVSSRCVYDGVAELGIYVSERMRGKGIGDVLLKKIIEESEQNGIWTLQSSIFEENIVSLRLHEKNGFRRVGIREKIGKLGEVWKNNILMERRSKRIGWE